MFDFSADMLYRIPALLLALTIHEYAHAAVADSLGDPTPRFTGRLTMNPFVHLDLVGTIMLVVAGFGWAKPVQVDPRYFRDGRKSMMAVSFAGPGANFFLAFISLLLVGVFSTFSYSKQGIYTFLFLMAQYNIWFALFNLIPVPPLDGSKILMSILPGKYAYQMMSMEHYSYIILLVLVFSGVIGKILVPIASFIMGSMMFIVRIIF